MRLPAPIVALGLLVGAAGIATCGELAREDASPIAIEHQGVNQIKWPIHLVRITLTNRNDRAVWFVVPVHAGEPLPENGTFVDEIAKRRSKPFRRFLSHNKGDDGVELSVVEMTFYSTPSVYMFHLPPRCDITLSGLPLHARTGVDPSTFKALTVLEADDLLVNGKTPLDEWLPYKTMSDANAKADRTDFFRPRTDADLERKKEERLPEERVQSIQATHIRPWTAHFEPQVEPRRPPPRVPEANPYATGNKTRPARPKKTAPPNQ